MMLMKKIELATAKVGGKFTLTVLMQKRIVELIRGAQKLVDTQATNPIEIVLDEIIDDKVKLVKK